MMVKNNKEIRNYTGFYKEMNPNDDSYGQRIEYFTSKTNQHLSEP